MAIAEEGRIYAQILHGKVHWIFDKSKLPEWNDEHCPAIDITGLNPMPEEGWSYDGSSFAPPVPDVEYAWQILREMRDRYLAQSDWTQFPDVQATMEEEKKAAWAVYRQALRDLPANTTDPFNVTWPVPPAGGV